MKLVAWIFCVLIVANVGPSILGADKPLPFGELPAEGYYSDAHQFLFFAVVEGCFNDGVSSEALDQIIPLTESGIRRFTVNFVISCPLCEAAYDGFCLYAQRKRFSKQWDKAGTYNTFGAGLDKDVLEELSKPGLSCRNALQGLIQTWVDERIVRHRLTDEETKMLRTALAKMRKKGEIALKRFQADPKSDGAVEAYDDWKACAICSGASPMGGAAAEVPE